MRLSPPTRGLPENALLFLYMFFQLIFGSFFFFLVLSPKRITELILPNNYQ